MTNQGDYCATPGSTLDVGDFVQHDGTWYRLDRQTDEVRNRVTGSVRTRVFRGVTKSGSARHLLLDSTVVKAYRLRR